MGYIGRLDISVPKLRMIFRTAEETLHFEIRFYQVEWVRRKFLMRKLLSVYKINEPFTNNHKRFIKLTYHLGQYKIFISSPNNAIITKRSGKKSLVI